MLRLATTENESRVHHYESVVNQFEFTDNLEPPFDLSLRGIDAFIVSCDQHIPSRLAIAACKMRGIPTFHILDGVIDWRTAFQNPKFNLEQGGTPLFQPLICDCAFAMGPHQKQQLRWLGNESVYATGLPRFDGLSVRECRVGGVSVRPRLLVATANTPWVTAEQQNLVTGQFEQLARSLESIDCDVNWRISGELGASIGVEVSTNGSAVEAIDDADSVISTPSTFAVESILKGVPTLIFDPFANPILTPSSWQATHWESVIGQLPSLFAPEAEKASHQATIVEKLTIVDGNASERIATAISRLVEGKEVLDTNLSNDEPLQPVTYTPFDETRYSASQVTSLEQSLAGCAETIGALRKEIRVMARDRANPSARDLVHMSVRYVKNRLKNGTKR